MARYFFHVVEGERHFLDEHGRELEGLHEAHTHALYLIEKLIRFVPDWPAANCRIRISLANGETVLNVLCPALTSPKRRGFGEQSGRVPA